ncbi:PH domain-containing protein [Streptomyces sp. ACA25]|uniref:PH domain-containing protein n=1 Tax=Streptomyces sp. ACA25 TaxID=3022596 RepID=UPI002307F11C|nr:PH domain-containing protein [Streptomyces sp. ACA25]MDB1088876.1 PH domain-containing protein [Streptomyces sp. ACA25]
MTSSEHSAQTSTGFTDFPVTFRPTRTRLVLQAGGAVTFAVLTLIAVLLPAGGAVPWGPVERAAIVLSALLVWALLALLSRPHAVAGPDGLTVVNLTTKRHLEWAQIVRVNLRTGDSWVSLDLDDGTPMPVMGIQPGLERQRALRDARTLRSLVQRYGTGPTDR